MLETLDFTCGVEACPDLVYKGGSYCDMHRKRLQVYGTLTPTRSCWECKQDFVLIGKVWSPTGNRSGARGPTCPECVETLERLRKYWPTHFGKVNLHGISVVQFLLVLEAQGFSCGLCCEPFKNNRSRHIDHDHSCCPGNWGCAKCIRGVVCPGCNTLAGFLENKTRLIDKFYQEYSSGRPIGGDQIAAT